MNKRILWDLGNETWELKVDSDEIRHFEIISRKHITNQDQVSMEEVVSLLPECPVPVEAIRHIISSDWEITEKEGECVSPPPLQPAMQNQQPLKREKTLRPSKVAKELKLQRQSSQLRPLQPLSPHPSDLILQAGLQEEQHPLTHPKNSKKTKKNEDSSSESSSVLHDPSQLWSSLSQWIPPTALYQPSLHQQAVLEMSEKTVHIHVSPKRLSHYHQRHGKLRVGP